jgi:hypothetical protein
MSKITLPPELLAKLALIKAKRAKTVIDHLLEHGQITTEELKNVYGYSHPPRAARDVRELGIVLERLSVKDAAGRSIAAYKFGDPASWRLDKFSGRKTFSRAFKESIAAKYGQRCAVCLQEYDLRYLQIDHRIPYHVTGETTSKERQAADYMLLCGSCNRAKSWSCEHCKNWLVLRKPNRCRSCYWASPEDYSHVALKSIRRLELIWTEREIRVFKRLKEMAGRENAELPDFAKALLKDQVELRRKR